MRETVSIKINKHYYQGLLRVVTSNPVVDKHESKMNLG